MCTGKRALQSIVALCNVHSCYLQDKAIRQWDVRDRLCSSVLRVQQPATVATWCPGGGILAVGDELGSITFFDVRKGNVQLACLQELHHDAVRAIAAPIQGEYCNIFHLSTTHASQGEFRMTKSYKLYLSVGLTQS